MALELDSRGKAGRAKWVGGGRAPGSAIGDYGGFVHWDLDKPAPEGARAPPRMGNTTSVVTAALGPRWWCAWAMSAQHKPGESIGYSLDGGRTWRPIESRRRRQSRAGSLAVSADGKIWVWTPEREAAILHGTRARTGLQRGTAGGERGDRGSRRRECVLCGLTS